jgi:hypothetical protein
MLPAYTQCSARSPVYILMHTSKLIHRIHTPCCMPHGTQEAAVTTLRWLAQRCCAGVSYAVAVVRSAAVAAASATERVLLNAVLDLSAKTYTMQQAACAGTRLLLAVVGSCVAAAVWAALQLIGWMWRYCKVSTLLLHLAAMVHCRIS